MIGHRHNIDIYGSDSKVYMEEMVFTGVELEKDYLKKLCIPTLLVSMNQVVKT